MAAGDMFLEFSGGNSFKGESPDDKYKETIQILSYSLGVSNAGSGAVGQGSGVSKAAFSDLSITKYTDKSSPNFFMACATGAHIDKAILHIRKSGEKPKEYLTITLSEVFVSSWSHSGADGGGLPSESASLNFSKIEINYQIQDEKGNLSPGPDVTFDVKKNVKV